MAIQRGSSGPDVRQLQEQLSRLGFYAGKLDADFGGQTDLAVKDFQRRLGLVPDGKIGPKTNQAISSALGGNVPGGTSFFKRFKQIQDDMFAAHTADAEHFAFLDRGIDALRLGDLRALPKRQTPESPFKKEIPHYPDALTIKPDGNSLVCLAQPASAFQPYPSLGHKPFFTTGNLQGKGLDFLSDDIEQACLCIAGYDLDGQTLNASWYGREALNNVQFWSATKYLQAACVVCQANKLNPAINISDCRIRGKGANQSPIDEKFEDLFVDMVSYRNEVDPSKGVERSNQIAHMLKHLCNSGEPDVQQWVSRLTGNDDLQFLGGYGFDALIDAPELYANVGPLVKARDPGSSSNRVSAYDLVRVITMLGWHNSLPSTARLPDAQWHSLSSLIKGLGTDTARYVDVALHELGLEQQILSPVILSKLGFGTLNQGTDALTYVALVQFIDPRPSPRQLRSFAFALRIPTSAALGPTHDAKMASEVTELLRRVVANELS